MEVTFQNWRDIEHFFLTTMHLGNHYNNLKDCFHAKQIIYLFLFDAFAILHEIIRNIQLNFTECK
jgi:hypothetical protein